MDDLHGLMKRQSLTTFPSAVSFPSTTFLTLAGHMIPLLALLVGLARIIPFSIPGTENFAVAAKRVLPDCVPRAAADGPIVPRLSATHHRTTAGGRPPTLVWHAARRWPWAWPHAQATSVPMRPHTSASNRQCVPGALLGAYCWQYAY